MILTMGKRVESRAPDVPEGRNAEMLELGRKRSSEKDCSAEITPECTGTPTFVHVRKSADIMSFPQVNGLFNPKGVRLTHRKIARTVVAHSDIERRSKPSCGEDDDALSPSGPKPK